MNTNSGAYFKRSSELMEKMMQSGICQYFYGEDEAQTGGSQPKNLQELFIKGLTLYFTLTGKTEQEKMTNFDIYQRCVSDKVKEVMKKHYKQFNDWTQIYQYKAPQAQPQAP